MIDQIQKNSMPKFLNKLKKTHFDIFSPFLGQEFFSKNLAVTCNTTWASNSMLSLIKKKLMNQSKQNLWIEALTDIPQIMGPF